VNAASGFFFLASTVISMEWSMHLFRLKALGILLNLILMACLPAFSLVLSANAGGILSSEQGAQIAQGLAGNWYGLASIKRDGFQIDLYVETLVEVSSDERLQFTYLDPLRGGRAALEFDKAGKNFTAAYESLFGWPVRVTGCVDGDERQLRVTFDGIGMTGNESFSVLLTQDSTELRRFSAPRRNETGERDFDYKYSPPRDPEEGIAVSSIDEEGLSAAPLERMVQRILEQKGDPGTDKTDSILIMRNGKLVFEEYFWGQAADNPHIISSVTKSVLSLLAGIAWDKNAFNLQDRVVKFFPDFEDTKWLQSDYPIEVRHLLSMTSGTDWDDGRVEGNPPSLAMLHSENAAKFVLNRPLTGEPSVTFNYDNGLPTLMGYLITRSVEQPLEAFADRHLFSRLGIKKYRWTRLSDGQPLAAGGLFLRPRDLVKLGQLVLDKGRWREASIVSEDWIDIATQQMTRAEDYPYGAYWHLGGHNRSLIAEDSILGLGQGGQVLAIIPSESLVVSINSSNWHAPFPGGLPLELITNYILPSLRAPM
jgi:CubicO group peptidase (beta-lactamase class C family)